jgi:hypothetical protein
MATVVLSLSSLQSSFAAIAVICEAGSELGACQCKPACGPTGPMHHKPASRPSARIVTHSSTMDADSGASESSDVSCCRGLPQGNRPALNTSTHQEIAVEIATTSLMPAAAPAGLASPRVHDPPNARPLYLTNSCLLI